MATFGVSAMIARPTLTSPPPRAVNLLTITKQPDLHRYAMPLLPNRMQEKTQLLPDDLVRLTLLVRRRVYFFTPSFPSSCHAVMSFFPPFFSLWER